jgi:hypothetical protein
MKLSVFEAVFLTIIIIFVSDIVYRYYETPMRIAHNKSRKFWISIFTLQFSVIAICVPTLILNKKPLSKQGGLIYTQSDIEAGKQLRFSTRIKICELKGWEKCDLPRTNKFNVLIIGDSHAVDALNTMYAVLPDLDYSMSQLGGCPPTARMKDLVPRTFPNLEECVKLNESRFDINYLKEFDAIVINVLLGWYSPAELNSYTAFLKKSGINKVIVFGGYFETKSELPILINEYGFDRKKVSQDFISMLETDQLLQIPTKSLGYLYVSKKNSLCTLSSCPYWKSGIPFTWDTHHLSFNFAVSLLKAQRNEIDTYLRN